MVYSTQPHLNAIKSGLLSRSLAVEHACFGLDSEHPFRFIAPPSWLKLRGLLGDVQHGRCCQSKVGTKAYVPVALKCELTNAIGVVIDQDLVCLNKAPLTSNCREFQWSRSNQMVWRPKIPLNSGLFAHLLHRTSHTRSSHTPPCLRLRSQSHTFSRREVGTFSAIVRRNY